MKRHFIDLTFIYLATHTCYNGHLCLCFPGDQITSLPAPSGGPFVLSAMKIMEGYMKNVTKADKNALYYHRLVEVSFIELGYYHRSAREIPDLVYRLVLMASSAMALILGSSGFC